MSRPKTILITGSAGFIGYHLAQRLLLEGYIIIGIDDFNNYYDVRLKEARLDRLKGHHNFSFERVSIEDRAAISRVFSQHSIDIVVHLAAQAGVRYSLENPHAYIDSNVVGFMNILECCRKQEIEHLLFASSSSVYGANKKTPFSTEDRVDHPVSLYAATKRANELMAHTYSHLYRLPTTGLRFFTVYGPWGRPDMSYFKFTKAIFGEEPIQIFNYGKMKRDFTYIDDIVEGIVRLLYKKPDPIQSSDLLSQAPYKIYNLGNNQPVELLTFISVIEEKIGKKAIKEFLPMQAGDVPVTFADVDDLMIDVGFKPKTSIEKGLGKFIDWYRNFYNV
ncbi:UDP-glucuronate 4-epimerase [Bacillus oleivorans]|uniref:UDP-glucuronate 4-epimerase n=1 Tax=Bacillus oleivorans TaxID=1448271 RepID=A0A285D2K3_9BACI|nr:NAD-dependent epimerase [Bacillus oleivorans]SNX74044.1 UDP-glucuronate 4-epimerase [Bacillus oleivorans]